MLGDPAYAAPLHAVDAWAAGLVLLEMANLRPAFPADSEVAVLLAVFRALGTPGPHAPWPAAAALPHFQPAYPVWPAAPASAMLRPEATAGGGAWPGRLAAVVDRLVVLDPGRRATAAAVLGMLALEDDDVPPASTLGQEGAEREASPSPWQDRPPADAEPASGH